MADHCALYSREFSELPLKELSELGQGSVFSSKRSAGRVSTCEFRWPDLRVEINVLPATDLKKHLLGFTGFVTSRSVTLESGIPEGLIERIRGTKLVLGIVVEPAMDPEERAYDLVTVLQILTSSLLFRADSVYDEQGNLLIGQDVEGLEEEAEVHDAAGDVSAESLARKERSMALLASEGVPVLKSLPLIESAAESPSRTTEEVARRALALLVVAIKGEGVETEEVDRLAKEYGIEPDLTPNEAAFLRDAQPSERDRVQFSWRYEACWILFWALGFVDKLVRPDRLCDVGFLVSVIRESGRAGFFQRAKLRPKMDLLDAADLIYRYHWAVVDARLNGRESPAGLDPGVVLERHHALNWLIGYGGQEWDDVSTDT